MKKSLRPILINGPVAYVSLTKGYVSTIDAKDIPLIEGKNWRAHICGDHVYAVSWGRTEIGKRKMLYMHRVLSRAPDGLQVDHKSRDTLDNRSDNLRTCTGTENQCNRIASSNNKSGLKGVWWCKQHKKWMAQICFKGRRRSLGLHDTKEDAHNAYASASDIMHGEFGRH